MHYETKNILRFGIIVYFMTGSTILMAWRRHKYIFTKDQLANDSLTYLQRCLQSSPWLCHGLIRIQLPKWLRHNVEKPSLLSATWESSRYSKPFYNILKSKLEVPL